MRECASTSEGAISMNTSDLAHIRQQLLSLNRLYKEMHSVRNQLFGLSGDVGEAHYQAKAALEQGLGVEWEVKLLAGEQHGMVPVAGVSP